MEEGFMSAPDEDGVDERLRSGGAHLVRAELRTRTATVRTITDGTIDRRELLAFLEYLAGSFDVGIPMLETLLDVQKRLQSKKLRAIIGEVHYAVSEEGQSLSAALGQHPKAFPALYVSTIEAGEASGQLGFAMRQLVDYIDWQEQITSQVRQATLYPLIVLGAVGMLVLGLIGFVFPRILPLLKSQTIPLPLPTRIIMAMSLFLRGHWGLMLAAVWILFGAYTLLRRMPAGRHFLDRMTLRLPITGELIREVNMARFVTYLSLFYRTGVELILALTLVERMLTNSVVALAVGRARESIIGGSSLAAAFGESSIFPPVVMRSIALGEATGKLDESLTRAKDYYTREIPAAVRRMITVLQPLLVMLLGGVILTVALAIVLPILNIYNTIGVRH
jgi:type II secretory pathway component PulF